MYFLSSLVGAALLACVVLARVYEAGYDDAALRGGRPPFVIHTATDFTADLGDAWELVGRAGMTTELRFIAALTYQRVDELVAEATAVSDPTSANYGAYWDLRRIDELLAPATEGGAAVEGWLRDAGIVADITKTASGFISVTVSVEQAEKLVCAHATMTCYFNEYRPLGSSPGELQTILRLNEGGYSLPAAVAPYIDLVGPVGDVPPIKSVRAARARRAAASAGDGAAAPTSTAFASAGVDCGSSVSAACLKRMYGVPNDILTGSAGGDGGGTTFQAVASFLEQCFDADDLHQELVESGRPSAAIAPEHIIGNAGCAVKGRGGENNLETMLDVEMIMSLSDSTTCVRSRRSLVALPRLRWSWRALTLCPAFAPRPAHTHTHAHARPHAPAATCTTSRGACRGGFTTSPFSRSSSASTLRTAGRPGRRSTRSRTPTGSPPSRTCTRRALKSNSRSSRCEG
jgi:hypothetical protein